MFSGDVNSVFGTQIFARASGNSKQFLVYSMSYSTDLDLAMILPLPTPPASSEDAVKFLDLSDYSTFFDDVSGIFPQRSKGRSLSAQSILKVQAIGSYEASFVPHRADFVRLDARFRLPENVWDQLPQYHDYGFAVFKLKAGEKNIHPIAFEFPTRETSTLFFPTVHVHHGQVEPLADFNHGLYCQSECLYDNWEAPLGFDRDNEFKPLAAKNFIQVEKTQGIVDPEMPIQKVHIYGRRANKDILVSTTDSRNTFDISSDIPRRSLGRFFGKN